MKWLIILGLVFVVALLIFSRYRKQIQMAMYVWRMFRKMRQAGSKAEERQIETKENSTDVALVRCARCGTWIPQTRALKLRSGVIYCSTACLETAAKIT